MPTAMTHVPTQLNRNNSYWIDVDQRYALQTWPKYQVALERGEGCWLWDVEGKRYLDMMAGQLCVAVGHSHPDLVKAVQTQAQRLMQTGSPFVTPEEAGLSRKLAELATGNLSKSFFGCTGSDSNETAIRMARFCTGRSEMVGMVGGYHGSTYGAWSVTSRGYRRNRPQYGVGLPGVSFIPLPEHYHCPFCIERETCLDCLLYGLRIIDETTSGRPSAVFVEPVVGGTVTVLSEPYMRELRRYCDERGALLIVDEAVTGIGRTGKWFALDHWGVEPDMITLSKGLGGAVPLSAVVVSDKIAEKLESEGYMNTTSHRGDPFLCGAALANIDIIEREGLLKNAETMGEYLRAGLEGLKARHEVIGDVRGLGLFLGMEFVKDRASKEPALEIMSKVENYCLENGLILFTTPGVAVMRFAPPLTINKAEVDYAISILDAGIRSAFALTGTKKSKAGRSLQQRRESQHEKV
jgi:4-aminobutyrate aminotransferase-like enzyme